MFAFVSKKTGKKREIISFDEQQNKFPQNHAAVPRDHPRNEPLVSETFLPWSKSAKPFVFFVSSHPWQFVLVEKELTRNQLLPTPETRTQQQDDLRISTGRGNRVPEKIWSRNQSIRCCHFVYCAREGERYEGKEGDGREEEKVGWKKEK